MQAPYQSHSETSQEAARKMTSAETLRYGFYEVIEKAQSFGRTGNELANTFKVAPGTASARLIELERQGKIIKTLMKRDTDSKRKAYVYVAKHHMKTYMGVAPIKAQKAKTKAINSRQEIKSILLDFSARDADCFITLEEFTDRIIDILQKG